MVLIGGEHTDAENVVETCSNAAFAECFAQIDCERRRICVSSSYSVIASKPLVPLVMISGFLN